ncbi:unnamed protein product [Nesidiocoris tenuis]|uniref:Uncharacterized protein n=1 Tax=Nesidiocoris tenuis TaxID=355587 RepID=A0A6H5G0C6_9HEMI|nr:unnamed protein product [Nesidiocoris tenuis]
MAPSRSRSRSRNRRRRKSRSGSSSSDPSPSPERRSFRKESSTARRDREPSKTHSSRPTDHRQSRNVNPTDDKFKKPFDGGFFKPRDRDADQRDMLRIEVKMISLRKFLFQLWRDEVSKVCEEDTAQGTAFCMTVRKSTIFVVPPPLPHFSIMPKHPASVGRSGHAILNLDFL